MCMKFFFCFTGHIRSYSDSPEISDVDLGQDKSLSLLTRLQFLGKYICRCRGMKVFSCCQNLAYLNVTLNIASVCWAKGNFLRLVCISQGSIDFIILSMGLFICLLCQHLRQNLMLKPVALVGGICEHLLTSCYIC